MAQFGQVDLLLTINDIGRQENGQTRTFLTKPLIRRHCRNLFVKIPYTPAARTLEGSPWNVLGKVFSGIFCSSSMQGRRVASSQKWIKERRVAKDPQAQLPNTQGDDMSPKAVMKLFAIGLALSCCACARIPSYAESSQPVVGKEGYPQPVEQTVSGGASLLTAQDEHPTCLDIPDAAVRIEKCFALTHPDEAGARPHPTIGIALSGGGSRAAPYAMGVLQGLRETGILTHADYISSVSGGSYAAFFLYSHLIANSTGSDPFVGDADDWFRDCIPKKYGPLAAPDGRENGAELDRQICPDPYDSYSSELVDGHPDPYRYQNFIRGNQSLLTGSCNYQETTISTPVGAYATLFAETLVQALPYFLANTLFDERLPISVSEAAYRHGIRDTYGSVPIILDATYDHSKIKCRDKTLATTLDDYSLEGLRRVVDGPSPALCLNDGDATCRSHKTPSWIINTTASSSGLVFDAWNDPRAPPKDRPECIDALKVINLRYAVFEISGYAMGSDLYGYFTVSRSPSLPRVFDYRRRTNLSAAPISVLQATAASGGFLDPQQRSMDSAPRTATASLMDMLGIVWGRDIGNYGYTKAEYDAMKGRHSVIPYPFYLGDYYRREGNSLYIHLSDGGQADNTGIYALLRRGVKTIIFADAGQDQGGTFTDLCALRKHLENGDVYGLKLDIEFDEQRYRLGEKFADFCHEYLRTKGKKVAGFDLLQWPYPVMHGNIVLKDEDNNENFNVDLYVLKPSVDLNAAVSINQSITLGEVVATCQFPNKLNAPACVQLSRQIQCDAKGYVGVPCEVVGFLASQKRRPVCRAKDMEFPQNSTVRATMQSSFTLYGAYRELGRFAASQLRYAPDGAIVLREAMVDRNSPQPLPSGWPDSWPKVDNAYNCLFGRKISSLTFAVNATPDDK